MIDRDRLRFLLSAEEWEWDDLLSEAEPFAGASWSELEEGYAAHLLLVAWAIVVEEDQLSVASSESWTPRNVRVPV